MLRIHLSGRVSIEAGGTLLGPDAFPAQQGRAAFAFLVGERGTLVSRSALADALRVYECCRTLISEELGVSPSPQTRAVHSEVLQSL